MMIPSQIDVIKRLSELSRLLDAATVEVAECDERAVVAKSAYEVAYARAFLESDGAMDVRKQIAVEKCSDLSFKAEMAAALHRAARERVRTLGVQIEVGRSISSATKSQFMAEPIGQYT